MLVGFIQMIRIGERFGPISLEKNQDKYIFDKVGIGTTNVSDSMFRVGAGSTLVAIDAGVIDATAGVNIGSGITLMPHGGGAFAGIITAISFNGNGANLTNSKRVRCWLDTG